MTKKNKDKEDLTTLGLSGKDYTKTPEWELHGYNSAEEWHDYLEFQKHGNDEEFDNYKSELIG